jgi:hypothetical protein
MTFDGTRRTVSLVLPVPVRGNVELRTHACVFSAVHVCMCRCVFRYEARGNHPRSRFEVARVSQPLKWALVQPLPCRRKLASASPCWVVPCHAGEVGWPTRCLAAIACHDSTTAASNTAPFAESVLSGCGNVDLSERRSLTLKRTREGQHSQHSHSTCREVHCAAGMPCPLHPRH